MTKIKPETTGYILRTKVGDINMDVVYHPLWHGPITDYFNHPKIQVIKFDSLTKQPIKP